MRQAIAMVCGVAALSILAGCAAKERRLNVASAPGQKVNVEMKASNFAFNPNVITAEKGDTLILNVENVSGERHNITVKNPSGDIVESKDIPKEETITLEVPLPTAGVYPFYCDIDLHSALGMKGQIEVK